MSQDWVVALLFFLAAVLATLSGALVLEMGGRWWRRRQVAKRLAPVIKGERRAAADPHDLVKPGSGDDSAGLASSAAGVFPPLRDLGVLLEQSRAGWGVGTFLILTLGLAVGLGGLTFLMSRSLVFGAVVALAGASGPYVHLARKRKARFARFEEEFPEAIDLLSRAIRAGHPLVSGVGMVAEEGPPEVALEFRRTFEEQRFGIPFDEALLGMVDRTDLVDVRIFAIAVLVQREVGGNLAEILETLSATIRKRFFLRRQLRTFTAQGRMTGYALAGIPVVLAAVLFLLQPDYMGLLFDGIGLLLVGMAVFLELIGFLWIRKIIAIDM